MLTSNWSGICSLFSSNLTTLIRENWASARAMVERALFSGREIDHFLKYCLISRNSIPIHGYWTIQLITENNDRCIDRAIHEFTTQDITIFDSSHDSHKTSLSSIPVTMVTRTKTNNSEWSKNVGIANLDRKHHQDSDCSVKSIQQAKIAQLSFGTLSQITFAVFWVWPAWVTYFWAVTFVPTINYKAGLTLAPRAF